MDCATAREIVWPPERPQLVEGDVLAARRHLESCPDCQDYLRTDEALTRLHAQGAVEPRPALRERVFERLATWRTRRAAVESERRSRRTRVTGLAAAALVLVASAAVAFAALKPEPPPPTVFIEDYIRRAVSEDRITTSDPEAVARFLARELGRPARPMTTPALVVISAEICLLDGIRGAMIQYEHNGRIVSHYLIPRRSSRAARPVTEARTDGPAVVTWVAAAFEQALIADLPPDTLLSLAYAGGAPRW